MSTEHTQNPRGKLEKLTEEQQSYIVWLAKQSSQEMILESLKEHGVDVSPATLSRFLKKRRAEEAVENGKDLAAAAEALAEQGRGGKLRAGTLEVMRQQFFEKAAGGVGGEEAQVMYAALVAEETRAKELALEARKVAALEQQVRLQERRIEVEAMKARAALGRVRARVVENGNAASGLMEVADDDGKVKGLLEDDRAKPEVRAGLAGGPTGAADGEPVPGLGNGARLLEVMKRAEAILNRGGDPGERMLEARGLLAEEIRKW